ncbi:hypothetical protein MUK42_11106 [Musa troglodytarum]|uniref:Uncharacterized protein n=1 Tax=Musa troglodytarum TaxID=320322 RepID=A0A9E7GL79_9LILI|nr:hypothetical protein MUK42_11106 [Musa troglodytarum]
MNREADGEHRVPDDGWSCKGCLLVPALCRKLLQISLGSLLAGGKKNTETGLMRSNSGDAAAAAVKLQRSPSPPCR